MKVLVIGARGFLGRTIVRVLAGRPGVEVLEAERSPRTAARRLDLELPVTFEAMDDCDVIVNASDSLLAPPDRAITYALERGLTFVETSAEVSTVERLLLAHDKATGTSGRLLLGAGLFPGVSNVVAASTLAAGGDTESIEFAARSSPFSGGGKGMCGLMVRALVDSVVAYECGQRVEVSPGRAGPRIRFNGRQRSTLRVSFAEVSMLRRSTNVGQIATYFAPRPSLSLFGMRALAALGVLRNRFAQRCLLVLLSGLRTVLLRNVPTVVTLTAIRNRVGRHRTHAHFVSIEVSDGVEAAASAVVAFIEALWLVPDRRGLVLPQELCDLASLTRAMRAISGSRLRIDEDRGREHDLGG